MNTSQNSPALPSEKAVAVLFVLAGIALRLIPHPWNFAPIAGLALFSGAFLRTRVSAAALLVALLISDLILGLHFTMIFTWSAFLLIMWIGRVLNRSSSWPSILGRAAGSSVLFFVVSNFGVFVEGSLYPYSWDGFVRCYWMALPFFKNTLFSDLIYAFALFGAYRLATAPLLARKLQAVPANSSVRAADTRPGR